MVHCSLSSRPLLPRITSPKRRSLSRPPMAAVLVPLHLEEVKQHEELIRYAASTAAARVFLYLSGPLAAASPTPASLEQLTLCFDPIAATKPTFDLVPLFPCVGWTPERLAELPELEEVVAAAEHLRECHALLDKINAARERLQQPSLSLTLTAAGAPAPTHAVDGDVEQQPGQQFGQQQGEQEGAGAAPPTSVLLHARVLGDWQGPLRFRKVAMGGTFDRLHAGHRLLLAATALVATSEIFVGITAQKLLQSKTNRDLLECYEAREAAALNYIQAVNPAVKVFSGPLNDPNEPPPAATDPGFDAIVVSEETVPGAEAINATRAQLGYAPLVIVVVGLIAPQKGAPKLSSTELRAREAEQYGRKE